MSRITADVIDVLQNEQTRVEILEIDGKDPKEKLGTKLYRHTINAELTKISGASDIGSVVPIYLICTRKEPFTESPSEPLSAGVDLISLADDNGIMGSYFHISYDDIREKPELQLWDYSGANVYYNFDSIIDTVEEL